MSTENTKGLEKQKKNFLTTTQSFQYFLMKISGGMHLGFIYKWYKNHFFPIILNGRKVDCPEMPLSRNAPVSPIYKTSFFSVIKTLFLQQNVLVTCIILFVVHHIHFHYPNVISKFDLLNCLTRFI